MEAHLYAVTMETTTTSGEEVDLEKADMGAGRLGVLQPRMMAQGSNLSVTVYVEAVGVTEAVNHAVPATVEAYDSVGLLLTVRALTVLQVENDGE